MRLDDETTAHQLHTILTKAGYNIGIRTVSQCRSSLGWVFAGSRYCQLIREADKTKRLEWARKDQNDFEDVIYTDESRIQTEAHCRLACLQKDRRDAKLFEINCRNFDKIDTIYLIIETLSQEWT